MRGHVIDFLMLPSWPVFNVADMCINVAAVLILVQAFRGVRLDGSRVPPRRGRPRARGATSPASRPARAASRERRRAGEGRGVSGVEHRALEGPRRAGR